MLHKAVTHKGVIVAKIPYLFRRNNIFYFRDRIPFEHQKLLKAKEVVRSLKTESREETSFLALKLAAHFKAALHDLKLGKASVQEFYDLNAMLIVETVSKNHSNKALGHAPASVVNKPKQTCSMYQKAPLLSVVST